MPPIAGTCDPGDSQGMRPSAADLSTEGPSSPAPERSLGLVVIDDHPAVRRGLCALLDGEEDLHVLAAVGSTREGLAAIERLHPDVALLDFHLPDEDGLSICLRTRRLARRPRVIVFSAFADEALGLRATVAGAEGLVSKGGSPDELFAAIRAVTRGERWLPPLSAEVLQAQGAKLDPEDLPVVSMLRDRVPEEEIAETLRVELSWLRARRWAILGRLGARGERRARPAQRTGSSAPFSSTAPPGPPAA